MEGPGAVVFSCWRCITTHFDIHKEISTSTPTHWHTQAHTHTHAYQDTHTHTHTCHALTAQAHTPSYGFGNSLPVTFKYWISEHEDSLSDLNFSFWIKQLNLSKISEWSENERYFFKNRQRFSFSQSSLEKHECFQNFSEKVQRVYSLPIVFQLSYVIIRSDVETPPPRPRPPPTIIQSADVFSCHRTSALIKGRIVSGIGPLSHESLLYRELNTLVSVIVLKSG